MTYEENRKVVEAAKVLVEYGKSRANGERVFTCPGCLFQRINEGGCCLKSCPCDWTIPTLTRWTPEDVALAKALKAFEVKSVERVEKGLVLYRMNGITYGMLPYGSFNSLRLDETVDLDAIIEEAEV